MKHLKAAISLGVLGVGGVMMIMTSSDYKPGLEKNEIKNPTVMTGTLPKRVPVLPTMDARDEMIQDVTSVDADETSKVVESSSSEVWNNFVHKSELQEYQRLHSKIFPSEGEKAFRKELVANERVLRSLQDLLQTPAIDDSATQMQNAALDLLFEALQNDPNGPAAQVLKAAVSNPMVEDTSLSLETRKSLAGVKAEILFNMSSMHPETSQELERLLPGPVSQHLWSNVKAQQQSNLAESSLEKSK
ncbi:hypothetical protein [Bdellovibrio bacteriovorus]|uniref:hypothetical protein n=1 Tax=Bdellovibrio TaxID=958 RepID=UPI0035A8BECE